MAVLTVVFRYTRQVGVLRVPESYASEATLNDRRGRRDIWGASVQRLKALMQEDSIPETVTFDSERE